MENPDIPPDENTAVTVNEICAEKIKICSENPCEPIDENVGENILLIEKETPGGICDSKIDEIIIKALDKVKGYFFENKMDEQKLVQFMYRMLTLEISENSEKSLKLNPEILDDVINDMLKDNTGETNSCTEVIDKLLGEGSAKNIFDKLTTEKVDEVVEKILGENTKKLISEKLENDNLDELLNKLVDEKLTLENNSGAPHPNFDEFIDKILGKDVEEFIRKKLQVMLTPKRPSEVKIDEVEETE